MSAPANEPVPIEALWTVKDAMKFLSLKRTAVYEACGRDLPHLRIGNQIRFVPAKVRAWVEEQSKRSMKPAATVLPITGGRR